jgi:hypothetical protein
MATRLKIEGAPLGTDWRCALGDGGGVAGIGNWGCLEMNERRVRDEKGKCGKKGGEENDGQGTGITASWL